MIAVVCHDAGGAQIISSWLKQQDEPFLSSVFGPARKIFKQKLGNVCCYEMNDAINKADWVLTGTSWQSGLEREAIKIAKKNHKKCISFLDHWVNYSFRFFSNITKDYHYPDEIWVGDDEAYRIASKEFRAIKIRHIPNPYFVDIKKNIENISYNPGASFILYLCTPIREPAYRQYGNENHWGFTEESAIDYFIEHVDDLVTKRPKICFKLHPSESKDKYQWVIDSYPNFDIDFIWEQSLEWSIKQAELIVGINSMGMVIGLISGKKVISAIPKGKMKNLLPFQEIDDLSQLIECK